MFMFKIKSKLNDNYYLIFFLLLYPFEENIVHLISDFNE